MAKQLLSGLTGADRASRQHVHVTFVQKAFTTDDGRLLLVCKSADDPYHPGLWEVPGGRMQPAEGLDEHIVREVREESGIDIEPGPPFHMWDWLMRDGGRSPVRAIAVGRICKPLSRRLSRAHQVPGDHISEVRWVALDELPGYRLIPGMDLAVEHFVRLHEQGLADSLST